MLVCPHCQLENPDSNKFCQGCGTSLVQKTCHECGTSVSFGAEKCNNCGANVGTIVWTIITEEITKAIISQSTKAELPTATSKGITLSSSSLIIQDLNNIENPETQTIDDLSLSYEVDRYLDANQRYQLKSSNGGEIRRLAGFSSAIKLLQGQVLDCQPLQKFYLDILQEQQPELFRELESALNKAYLSVTQYWNLIGVPTIALPYLILQQFSPAVSKVYDAWQEGNKGIVLLEDRSLWQTVLQFWQTEDLPSISLVWFLDKMAELWTPLSQVGCCQSLLVLDNLRIDRDQSFSLQQLYIDSQDSQYSLKDLAQVWQQLLNESGQKVNELLDRLLNRVMDGEIEMVEELRSQLQNLSFNEQSPATAIVELNDNTQSSEEQSFQPDLPDSVPSTTVIEPENTHFTFEDEDDRSEPTAIAYEEDEEEDEEPTVLLPMKIVSFADAGHSDIGSSRNHNEDYFSIETNLQKRESVSDKNVTVRGLYIVCDGMGGHEAGEVASATAVNTLKEYFHTHWQKETLPDEKVIADGVFLANQTIYNINQKNASHGSGRMGTTMVVVLLQDNQVAIAHVGDSRVYKITRKKGLEKLTIDHEVGQREIIRGVEPEIAYARPDAYQLTQALGPRNNNLIRPDIQFLDIQEDSLLLLCSDGLSDNDLLENNWQTYFSDLINPKTNLEQGLLELVKFANQYNGHDNITGVIIRLILRPFDR